MREEAYTRDAVLPADVLCSSSSDECYTVLLAPEALAASIAETPSEAVDLASNWRKLETLLGELYSSVLESPEKIEVKALPSYGVFYGGNNLELSIYGPEYGDLELSIFMAMLEALGQYSCDRVVLDTSVGYNIYVSAASRAFRTLVVAYKLGILDRLLLGGDKYAKFYVSAASPVRRGYKGPYPLSLQEVGAKIFPSFPLLSSAISGLKPESFISYSSLKRCPCIDETDLDRVLPGLKAETGRKWGRLVASLKVFLKQGLKLFTALRLNTPLVLYQPDIVLDEEPPGQGEVEEAINGLMEFIASEAWRTIKSAVDEGRAVVCRLAATRSTSLYTILALLETMSLIRLARHLMSRRAGGMVPLRELEWFKEEVYEGRHEFAEELRLNARMLERDLKELKLASTRLSQQCQLYSTLRGPVEEQKQRQSREDSRKLRRGKPMAGDIKRNFFAHSGLLDSIVNVCKSGDEITVTYTLDENMKKQLNSWLLSPE
ncbi:hypothetical protein Pdsh_06555 [Pyrodictium delaneyi]|nr:hypothetical protein Pdsh_06770 [Pyrodictium delaneyi]OWJ54673.1 hypothetical protein Pdsh_06555 [Pyrodictium delaneyi]